MKKNIEQQMVEICQNAFYNKLFSGTSGNLSYFNRENGTVYITPTSVRYETLTANDIVLCDINGNLKNPLDKPSSEWQMHLGIYKTMSDVNAVFHTHSPFATAFSAVGEGIPEFLIEMRPFLNGSIPCSSFAKAGSAQLGVEVSKCLIEHNVYGCLLANHGVVTVGANLEQSHIRAEYVEDAAKIYHHARQIGAVNKLN